MTPIVRELLQPCFDAMVDDLVQGRDIAPPPAPVYPPYEYEDDHK
jgi:hypothetical protein